MSNNYIKICFLLIWSLFAFVTCFGANESSANANLNKSIKLLDEVEVFTQLGETSQLELWSKDHENTTTFINHVYIPEMENAQVLYNLHNNVLFFSETADGIDLWSTDGTVEGTVKLNQFTQLTKLNSARIINEGFYFSMTTIQNHRNLWKSNGTISGTIQVQNLTEKDIANTKNASLSSFRFFTMQDGSNTELWKSGGGLENPELVKSVPASETNEGQLKLKVIDNTLFCGVTTTEGITQFFSLDQNTGISTFAFSKENTPFYGSKEIVEFDGFIYYMLPTENGAINVWKSNGIEGGTQIVSTFNLKS